MAASDAATTHSPVSPPVRDDDTAPANALRFGPRKSATHLDEKPCAPALWHCIIPATLSAVAVVLVLLATRWGAGLSPDSLRYLRAARDLPGAWSDAGLTGRLASHFAPLFPLLLSTGEWIQVDPWVLSRYFNAALMGLNTLLIARLMLHSGGSVVWPAVAGVALVCLSTDHLLTHSMVWTEPVFIFFMLWSILALRRHLRGARPFGSIVWVGLPLALACLTRYAGLALVLASATSVLLLSDSPLRRRLNTAALLIVLAILPLSCWIIRNLLVTGTAVHRQLSWHPISWEQADQLRYTVTSWWVPDGLPDWLTFVVRLTLLGAAIAGFRLLVWRYRPRARLAPDPATTLLLKLLALLSAGYVIFLLVSMSVVDRATRPDFRILVPLFVLGTTFNTVLLRRVLGRLTENRIAQGAALVMCIVLVIGYAYRATAWATESRREGLVFAKAKFTDPALHEAIRALPRKVKLYSNCYLAMRELLQRGVSPMPTCYWTGKLTAEYRDSEPVARLTDALRRSEARVLHFRNESRRNMLTVRQLNRICPLEAEAEGQDWQILRHKPEP